MIRRHTQPEVEQSLRAFPVVGLVGPRQVGKTTLARAIAADWTEPTLHLDLESPADLAKLQDPELLLSRYADRLVIIDEAQQRPDLFPVLRVLVDRDRRPGRFLILGSASPDLKRQAAESLAGRIAYHELAPLSLAEVAASHEPPDVADADALHRLWLRGGFPDSYLAADDVLSMQWRANFIQTHLERDLPALGVRTPAMTLRRFWTMVAHGHGQTWNSSRIGESLGVDHKTARRYLDLLCDTFMLRQLPACHANVKKRLVKSPKAYVRCPGLLHALLNIGDWQALQGHPIRGASWEGFCIEQILAAVPPTWDASFYRTQVGGELDLVLRPVAMQPPIAIEIKASSAPQLTRGNWRAIEDLSPRATYVVYPGDERYALGEGVETLPAAEVGRIVQAD